MTGFDETLAIVVGGSRGLGADVAEALRSGGARVVTVSRHPPSEQLASEHVLLDATDADSVSHFFDEWRANLGERNFLVNFAGSRYNIPLVESDPREWWRCVESSLLSTYLMTRGFALASDGRPGAIVNMASIHATAAARGRTAYGTAKAAVSQFTAIASTELAPVGIRVNCVAPGFVKTQASEDMIAAGTLDGVAIERRTPLGRLATPTEITSLVLFLLSEESMFITGETIRIDGGWLGHAEV